MLAELLLIVVVAAAIGAVVAVTSPLWMRLAIRVRNGLCHQLQDAGSALENDSEKEKGAK